MIILHNKTKLTFKNKLKFCMIIKDAISCCFVFEINLNLSQNNYGNLAIFSPQLVILIWLFLYDGISNIFVYVTNIKIWRNIFNAIWSCKQVI